MNSTPPEHQQKIDDFLARLEQSLAAMEPKVRITAVNEIRAYLHGSIATGKPVDQILEEIGSPEVLALAYQPFDNNGFGSTILGIIQRVLKRHRPKSPSDSNPATERYLTALTGALTAMPEVDRREVVDEIRVHLQDATAAGKPLDEILSRLGPAESLAKAYLVESYLNPKTPGAGWISRTLGLFGLLVFSSLPTLLITSLLAPLGIAFLIAGPVLFTSGICGFFDVSLAPVVRTDLEPWEQVLLGPIMGLVGAACLWVLYRYLRWILKLVRQVASGR